MRGSVLGVTVGAVSALLLLAGVAWIGVDEWQSRQDEVVATAGARPAVVPTEPSASGEASSVAPIASPLPWPASAGPTTPGSSTASPSIPAVTFPVPRIVRIPAIDVSAQVVPVGLTKDDALGIPDDVALVGWYRLGVPPGADRGSAVLVAHRDGRGQGRGVFYDLGRLEVGDRVTVRTDAGESVDYSVVARESIRKQRLPYDELFSAAGPPRLTLISCGGPYDPENGGYQDNVVVTAVPAADA